ncbi:hypothetical protein [Kineococcus arenarius]|uniref:hypothetical protein n=1 Tax=Kineococcus sp. SYSU DK007 TaxID=3383128 RepID=UPI003D7DAC77
MPLTSGGPLVGHCPVTREQVRALAAGQVLGGLGAGATLSLGALLVTEVSGSPASSEMAATTATLGAALLAVPLARLAQPGRRGRPRARSLPGGLGHHGRCGDRAEPARTR